MLHHDIPQPNTASFSAALDRRAFLKLTLLALPCAWTLAGCGGGGGLPGDSIDSSRLTVEPWPEMDDLFRSDPRWLGGDGVYSVDLGAGRSLWLFGDSFVGVNDSRRRAEGRLIHNSLAILDGDDPSTATIRFYRGESGGEPTSFFADRDGYWYWPGHGVRLASGTLMLFMLKIRSTGSGSWGFEAFGTQAVFIDNPDAEPTDWQQRWKSVGDNPFGVVIASAGVLVSGDYLYAYGTQKDDASQAYLTRWPLTDVEAGRLDNPEWTVGGGAWTRQSQLTGRPPALFGDAQSEFTVHRDARLGQLVEFQSVGFGASELAYRLSGTLEQGWSGLQRCYRPPESDRSGALVYQGKAHPMLRGAEDIALSYSTGHEDFQTLLDDLSLGYPRFLKGTWRQE